MSESNGSWRSPRLRLTVAQQLLAAGVPLSLLIDLVAQDGPDSAHISAYERPDD